MKKNRKKKREKKRENTETAYLEPRLALSPGPRSPTPQTSRARLLPAWKANTTDDARDTRETRFQHPYRQESCHTVRSRTGLQNVDHKMLEGRRQ